MSTTTPRYTEQEIRDVWAWAFDRKCDHGFDEYGHVERESGCLPCEFKRWGRLFVNVYAVERCYGGAEEGGWYYDAGTPHASVPVTSLDEAVATRLKLEQQFAWIQSDRGRYSVIGGPDLEIALEPGFAQAFPDCRPHYE